MIQIDKNNHITMARGDSWSAPVFINKGTPIKPLRYYLKDEDRVYLAIMEPNQPFENAIVKKTYTNMDENKNGDVVVRIDPDDTVLLVPGLYYYQIKARLYKPEKPIYRDINITSEGSMLKKDSTISVGSILNGVEVTQCTHLADDLTISVGDKIKADSIVMAGSVINEKEIEAVWDTNTIVQKSKFSILE